MVNALIVDDESLARRRIRHLLEQSEAITEIYEADSGGAAVNLILEQQPDLVYLDIELGDMTGFDVLASIPKETMPLVIFVTSFDEYAIKAFDVFSFDYLLKPFDPARFSESLDRALIQLALERTQI